jgi:peptidyl-prolyl cis-trans isomerase C
MDRRATTTLMAAALCAMWATACDAPRKPNAAGPGIKDEARAKTVDEVPEPREGAVKSELTEEQRSIVLAEFGDKKLTLGMLEARLAAEPAVVRQQYATVAKRKEYLASWVQFELLAAEAREQGYDKDPEVAKAMLEAMVRRYLRELAEQAEKTPVSEEDTRAYYDNNPQLYRKPAMVEIRHMRFGTRVQATKVHGELSAAADGTSATMLRLWNDYVGRVSNDQASVPRLGSLGWVSKEIPDWATPEERARMSAVPRPLIDAAFALEPYQLSEPVESEQGWHIVTITSRSPAVDQAYEDVKASITGRIQKRRRDLVRKEKVEALREAAKVDVDDDKLRLLPTREPKAKPGKKGGRMGPGGHDHGHGGHGHAH